MIEALFLSDVHLGSRGSKADLVLKVLKNNKPKKLFLVGDFIDGWLLSQRPYWPQSHINVIQYILKLSKKGTEVIYLTGNHDDFLREYENIDFGNIKILEQYVFRDFLVIHGDRFDGVVKLKWLGKLGAFGYEFAISVDRLLRKVGYKKSLSKFLKTKVKEAVKFISRFENELSQEALRQGCKGVICGHIHQPQYKFINNISYFNCGDWIENFTYVTYTQKEGFKLCYHKT